MDVEIKKEILDILGQTIEILEQKEEKDVEELKELSNHGIDDVALHKNLDLISIAVLVYSLYKIAAVLPQEDYLQLVNKIKTAKQCLQERDLGKYNQSIKALFQIIKKSNAKIKVHLQDVLHAARVKKSAILLEKGLSIGQAAGLMGLSNWDLQSYVGKTTSFEQQQEKVPAKTRVQTALKIFGVKY
ncbi:MAG: hypothetical protein AABW48_06250 [Nanoarchaeota archaeon]